MSRPPVSLTPDFEFGASTPPPETSDPPQAWELIDVGRYQPRRIRGSLLGRALG